MVDGIVSRAAISQRTYHPDVERSRSSRDIRHKRRLRRDEIRVRAAPSGLPKGLIEISAFRRWGWIRS